MTPTLNWQPHIGDPTTIGWITATLYLITSALAFAIAMLHRAEKIEFHFWGLLTIFLLLLCINKQLDIQTLFTEIGRFIAKKQGWYTERRVVQFDFIIVLGCAALALIILTCTTLQNNMKQFFLPLSGFLLLITFIVIRAASFHHVDRFLKSGPAELRINWILELGGIGIVFISVLVKLKKESEHLKKRLTPSVNDIYYLLKPILPRRVQLALRRTLIKMRLQKFHDIWPITKTAGNQPSEWMGWPEGEKFAVLITHDIESQRGILKCRSLAEIDLQYGFKSSFNIVPHKYPVPPDVRLWLQSNGFEVGVHDYNHDGKLYKSKSIFNQRAAVINRYMNQWNASGFRSASMHHNLDWITDLNILYDCSTFDTDPFEPQSDGVNTIFPFWYQHASTERGFVEIPYTLPQDFTLFILKRERDCGIWKKKLKWIADRGGMATVIIHPDYINFSKDKQNRIDEYSFNLYVDFLEHIKLEYKDQYWNPLPNDFAFYVKLNCSKNVKCSAEIESQTTLQQR